jgi:hypothetical protein
MTRWLAVPVVAIVILGVGGCARSAFTIEEYAAAYQRYAACMIKGGTPLIERDLTGPVYDYSVPMAATYLGTADFCYADFRLVDETWRNAQQPASDGR